MEGLLARGLAKPLDPEGDGKETLAVSEAESLWELARLGDSNVGLRFLDEATRDLILVTQLRARAEPALVAAVGLDETKRDRAIGIFERQLHEPHLSPIEKVDVAFIALELADRPGPLTEACAESIITGLASNPSEAIRRAWFVPKDALSSHGMDWTMPEHRVRATRALSRVERQMSPIDSERFLLKALAKEADLRVRAQLARSLVAVTNDIEPAEATTVLTEALALAKDDYAPLMWITGGTERTLLVDGLISSAKRLRTDDAVRVLSQAFVRETDAGLRGALAQGIAATSASKTGSDRRVLQSALQILSTSFEKAKNAETLGDLAWSMGPLADRLVLLR